MSRTQLEFVTSRVGEDLREDERNLSTSASMVRLRCEYISFSRRLELGDWSIVRNRDATVTQFVKRVSGIRGPRLRWCGRGDSSSGSSARRIGSS